jgi:uncharacterized protein (DUF302 family)
MRTRMQRTTKKAVAALSFERSVRLADTGAGAALGRAKNAFSREGFGVVAEIDLRDTLERKLDKDIGPYWVLEICNPMLADRTLAVDRMAGLLLPCKVAVWQDGKDAVVAALRPEVAVSISGLAGLEPIALEADQRIERALVRLEGVEVEPIADLV